MCYNPTVIILKESQSLFFFKESYGTTLVPVRHVFYVKA